MKVDEQLREVRLLSNRRSFSHKLRKGEDFTPYPSNPGEPLHQVPEKKKK